MTRKYLVKLEKNKKVGYYLVDAVSELDAIMQARTEAKDHTNTSHIVSVSLA